MSNSLKASTTGLTIVDKARKRLGWTKTSTARWWQDAHTSRATLRRFWQGDRIQQEIFIAICQAVGINDWQSIAEIPHTDLEELSTQYLDWDEAPDVESFYGRIQELAQIEQWILAHRCKLITITGIAGIGKTALALALADRLQLQFDGLIWKTLHSAPSLVSLLDGLLHTFKETPVDDIPQDTAKLIHHLQQRRYLLILDGLDESEKHYHQFIQQLSLDRHQSCILLTSRQQPNIIESNTKTVHSLTLTGLPKAAAVELLQGRGFTGKELGLSTLIQLYRGNPLALKLVTPLIQSVFGGNIAAFLSQNTIVIGDRLRAILQQQFEQLSDLEQEILYWLAIWQQPISFSRLQTNLLISLDPATVLAAIVSLERRSLLEKWICSDAPAFTLQPLVMKIVTDELVERATQEIIQVMQSQDIADFKVLRTHWLLRPGSDDIVGDRILHQLQEKLWQIYGANLVQNLQQILLLLNDKSPLATGYIACNITTIIKKGV
ncbi:NB-ARC domain-containing protein [Anabaena sp. FACHB-709]|uniref:NB-ARC domain-containing protein n=2 Tax=Nostocaceae TaxID=1162 RepID=A0A1Z4KM09_ANAVA|nr:MULTISPECIES: NB-ARC domain-containing protein [Nostocaceae]BAY70020.1 NB-ARC domain-containing protein [Trichormus variabilis NIES-23]HBW32038.1 NACHT domain-containing protein [Nostoc sp. UBA8866]MBD2174761.1 NACHT domain-containing protein [Anabaena cylindrica FACHB-318]MBD2266522.1 NACHT domain-containing protein [Anabaena sp. FACHB-709]MBD2276139.1 NACHT domain-containing protein [Nostoc sp. PCC 7120 = FACHB-418]